jgi:hypothetical protein
VFVFRGCIIYVDYTNYHFQTKPKSLFKTERQSKDMYFIFAPKHKTCVKIFSRSALGGGVGSGEVFSPVPDPALGGSVCEGQSSLALSNVTKQIARSEFLFSFEVPLCIPLAVRSHQTSSCLLYTAKIHSGIIISVCIMYIHTSRHSGNYHDCSLVYICQQSFTVCDSYE